MADDNQNPATPPSADPVDFTKLSDEQFSKVLEDPRLFNLPRIKQLQERSKKVDESDSALKKAEEERQKLLSEHTKLLEEKDKAASVLKEQLNATRIDNKIANYAQSLGAVDLDAVIKLVDRSKVAVGDDGTISGIEDAVNELQSQKVFLFTKPAPKIGDHTNPTNQDTGEFTLSQIQDPVFYQKNADAIRKASAQGKIKNDRQ